MILCLPLFLPFPIGFLCFSLLFCLWLPLQRKSITIIRLQLKSYIKHIINTKGCSLSIHSDCRKQCAAINHWQLCKRWGRGWRQDNWATHTHGTILCSFRCFKIRVYGETCWSTADVWMDEWIYVCILLPLGKWQVSGLTCTKSSFSRSNQIKFYLYSTFLKRFLVEPKCCTYKNYLTVRTLYSKYNSTVCAEYQYEKTTPSVLRPSHRTRKDFRRKTPQFKGKMGETSGRATEEGSLSQDGQTCNRCRV